MFNREDNTYNEIREKSLFQWLDEMEKHEDIAVRGGVKLTREYIQHLKDENKRLEELNKLKNEYLKKDLNERWNNFGDYKIQRDLYSAFLIMNIKDNLKEINRDLCIETFDNFKELHNKEVERIRNSNNKLISSMGI